MNWLCCCSESQYREHIVSKITNEHLSNAHSTKIPNLSTYFPCRYLGEGIYGATVEVFSKDNKEEKHAQKIIYTAKLREDFAFLYGMGVKGLPDNCVNVRGWLVEAGRMYIMMEEMRMGDLRYYLMKNGKLFDEVNLLGVAVGVVLLLDKLHGLGLIYRNLRPENILITTKEGHILFSEAYLSIVGPVSHSFMGCAEYAPPEVYQSLISDGYTFSLDIWMFGVLLYELVAKKTPFSGSNVEEIKQKVCTFSTKKLVFTEESRVGEDVKELISMMLNPNSNQRPTLPQIKAHPYFKGVNWEQARPQVAGLPLKYKDQHQIQFPKRIAFENIRCGRPLVEDFPEYFFQDI